VRESYDNPVIPGFHPDPSVCRVGDNFFLVTSTFTYFPGIPIFTSKNLVDWSPLGHVLDRPSQVDLGATSWMSGGVYAPTLRHHDGRFWMITTNVTDAGTVNFFVTADDPAGPWSDPVVVAIDGIDPDLCWDDDGNCWVHFSQFFHVARCRIDDRTGEVLDAPEPTWSGAGLHAPEAPHLFRRGEWWYLLIAEGGTEWGHCVSIARGPSPTGPWEACPANPILSHRSTGHPIQNTGHADLVEAADGSWWMVFLGVRPVSRLHALGRETFLTPVTWVDDWPVVDDVELSMEADLPTPRAPVIAPARDDFDTERLDPMWVSVRDDPAAVSSLEKRPGRLVVHDGGYVARRQQHHRVRVEASVERGSATAAGLRIMMDEHHRCEIALRDGAIVATGTVGEFTVEESIDFSGDRVVLAIDNDLGVPGPDRIRLEVVDDGGTTLLDVSGRYLTTEVTGGFVGRTIGMFSSGGDAAFDWFDYRPVGA